MNTTLDNSFQTDFNTAMKMSGEKYSYEELMTFLSTGKILEKHIAALELNELKSKEDALILVSNLVGQNGKVREAVAFKINELAQKSEYFPLFIDKKIFDILRQGIMDINGNVCRHIISGKWFENTQFRIYLCTKLPESINKILNEIKQLDFRTKQYVLSKRNFQLYWALEALFNIIEQIELKEIKRILFDTAQFSDYTIREKTAKILAKIDDIEFDGLKEQLKNDENYYVRRYLN